MHVSDSIIDFCRRRLDYSFHATYPHERCLIQNDIIRQILLPATSRLRHMISMSDQSPVGRGMLVMMAGPIGAGKSTIAHLLFDSQQKVIVVDMDYIRERLPESETYRRESPELFGQKTQRESGYIAELVVRVSLLIAPHFHIVKDASMVNIPWQKKYISHLKQEFDGLKVMIIHVTASETVIRQRVEYRNRVSGRVVPEHVLVQSLFVILQTMINNKLFINKSLIF